MTGYVNDGHDMKRYFEDQGPRAEALVLKLSKDSKMTLCRLMSPIHCHTGLQRESGKSGICVLCYLI